MLPPPPASNKTRVPHQAILQPTPVCPPQKPNQINKPPNTSTLQIIEDSSTKSKSLPRGLPSDGSAFASFQQPQTVDEAEEANIEELQLEFLRLQVNKKCPNNYRTGSHQKANKEIGSTGSNITPN